MTKIQLLDYLKENELDIQAANASLLMANLVFGAYVQSHKLHGIKFGPVCSYFSYGLGDPFRQIISKQQIVELNDRIHQDYKKDRKSLDKMIKEHQSLTRSIDGI